VGSSDGKLYALNGKTGAKIWEVKTGLRTDSPAIGVDGTVYIPFPFCDESKLYALDGKTGAKKWEFRWKESVKMGDTGIPAIGDDGTVYFGTDDNKLYALDGKTGTKKWEFETGGSMISSPVIGADGTLYIGSGDKKIYAIKTDSKGPANSPWPMRGQNAQHTGRAPKK
jgi:outer membrane protein assembly factor BamB